MKSKVAYNFYDILDYKDFEQYLQRMIDKGWMVESMEDRLIKFKPCVPKEFQIALDFFAKPSVLDEYSDRNYKDYLALCEASGWTLCCHNNRQVIFYAPKDQQTIPLQTEKNIEFEIANQSVWKTERWYTLFTIFIFALMGLLLYYTEGSQFLYHDFALSIIFISLFVTFVLLIRRCYRYYTWLFVNKKNIKKNLEIKAPKRNYRINIHTIFTYRSYLLIVCISSLGVLLVEQPFLYLINDLVPLLTIGIYTMVPAFAIFLTYKTTNKLIKICVNIIVGLLLLGAIVFQATDTIQTQIPPYISNLTQVKEMMENSGFSKLDYTTATSSISTPLHYKIGLSQGANTVNITHTQAKTSAIAQYFLNDYMTFQYQVKHNMVRVNAQGAYASKDKPAIEIVKQAFTPYSNPDWSLDEAYVNDTYFIFRKDTTVFEIKFPYQSFTNGSNVYHLIDAYYQSTLSK